MDKIFAIIVLVVLIFVVYIIDRRINNNDNTTMSKLIKARDDAQIANPKYFNDIEKLFKQAEYKLRKVQKLNDMNNIYFEFEKQLRELIGENDD